MAKSTGVSSCLSVLSFSSAGRTLARTRTRSLRRVPPLLLTIPTLSRRLVPRDLHQPRHHTLLVRQGRVGDPDFLADSEQDGLAIVGLTTEEGAIIDTGIIPEISRLITRDLLTEQAPQPTELLLRKDHLLLLLLRPEHELLLDLAEQVVGKYETCPLKKLISILHLLIA